MSERQFVVFKLGEEEFAVPISQVREIMNYIPPTRIPGASDFMQGVINLRGNLLPIIDLGMKLNIKTTDNMDKHIVINDIGAKLVGAVVDQVAEVTSLKEEDIETAPVDVSEGKNYISGIAKMKNRLLILLDFKKLMN